MKILSYRCAERDHHVTSPERLTECPVCGGKLKETTAMDIANTVRVVKRGH